MSIRSRMQRSPRFARRVFNVWPCIRGTGARVTYIADDWSEIRLRLPLSLRTRNYVGTIFGGSLYAAVDPWAMLMLINRLGPEYVVWDRAAAIAFRKPGTGTLTATVRIDDAELAQVRTAIAADERVDRTYVIDLVDQGGDVCARVEKVVYVASRAGHERRRHEREAER